MCVWGGGGGGGHLSVSSLPFLLQLLSLLPTAPQISKLHPPGPQYADTEPQPQHISGPRTKLRARKAAGTAGDGSGADGGGAPQGEKEGGGGEGAAALSMDWLCVLWQRGLNHPNLQVQKMALRSFLQRAWCAEPPTQAQQTQQASSQASAQQPARQGAAGARAHGGVPLSFVVEVLLPALTCDFHYKGVTGGYSVQVWCVCVCACVWCVRTRVWGGGTHAGHSNCPASHSLKYVYHW